MIAVVAEAGALAPSVETPVTVSFDPATRADSLAAAAALQDALNARWDASGLAEREPAVLAASELQSWTRAPSLPPPDAWRRGDESDGRWLWLAALVLLGLEHVLRRTPAAETRARDARAA